MTKQSEARAFLARNPKITVNRRAPKGEIEVHRKAYTMTTSTGKKVRVPALTYLMEDRGEPGPGPKTLPKLTPGLLYGYHIDEPAAKRHKALRTCVRETEKKQGEGYRRCLSRVMVLRRYMKNTGTKKQLATLEADKNWLKKEYGGPGSFGPRKKKRKKR